MGHYLNTKPLPFVIVLLSILFNQYASALPEDNSTNVNRFSNFNLIKCRCKEKEILNNSSQCTEYADNSIYFTSFQPYDVYQVYLEDFKSTKPASFDFGELCKLEGKISMNITNIYLAQFNTTSGIQLWHGDTGAWYEDYCVEHIQGFNESYWQAIVCMEQLTASVPSCCPDYHVINDQFSCIPDPNALFSPVLYMGENLVEDIDISAYVKVYPKCDIFTYDLTPGLYTNLSGALIYNKPDVILATMDYVMSEDHFCVAVAMERDDFKYIAYGWHETFWAKCENVSDSIKHDDTLSRCELIMYWVDLPLLFLSTLLLSLIIILYVILPELRKSLGSKMILCHMLSLLFGFIILIILHLPQDANCKIYGPLVQLCFLSSFFWLNVMCFDMWIKLRCIRPTGQSERSAQRRFIAYSIYGWGCPIIITTVTVLMDNITHFVNDTEGFIVPGWGVRSCWFGDSSAAFLYYFGPIAFLMSVNLFFFVWVFFTLLRANVISGRILKNNTTPSHRRVWIYLKIFFMMGVSWIFEYISWQEGTCEYWIVTDIINALRGVILFLILFGSRKTITKVNEKLGALNERLHARLTSSVNTIRRLSLVSNSNLSQTVETRIDSRRTSEFGNENVNKLNLPKLKKETNKISSV